MSETLVKFDTSDVQRAMRQSATRFSKAVRRSRQRAALAARTVLVRAVASDMKLKVSVVREQFSLRESATTSGIAASVRRVPLYDFLPGSGDPRGPYPSRGKKKVRVRGKVYPGAFVARMGSGHWGIFKRTQPWRLPIAELHGASIWKVALTHVPAAQAAGMRQFDATLASEINYRFGGGDGPRVDVSGSGATIA